MKEPERPGERRRPRVKKLATAILKSESGRGKAQEPAEPVHASSQPTRWRICQRYLSQKVVGQPAATRVIVPYIQMFQAGLAPEGRPVGVFLLLGPTGTGKTKTIEALADVLHGSEKNVLKVDCGEFQMEHEVAKLIGAPPGYLGHRETQPMLTQQKLNAVTSEKCSLSLVLFDEIEKAAPSMTRLLLGVLDKGLLRLGDNSTVNFEKSLVFLTSNLGAREMMREINPEFGFQSVRTAERADLTSKLQSIALVRGAQALLAGVRQPHRLHHHLPAADRRIALHHSRSADRRSAEPRQHAAGQSQLHARCAVRNAASSCCRRAPARSTARAS